MDGVGSVGWAIARLLARHGAGVAVLDRDSVAADRTVSQIQASGGTATPVIADVTIDEDCARAVAEARDALGGLDTLVNNVAAWSPAEVFDIEPDQFDELLDLNAVADNLPAEAREPRRRMSALQTEGDCWDAAAAVLFLSSPHARWISGQVLAVDGGGAPRAPYPGVTRAGAAAS